MALAAWSVVEIWVSVLAEINLYFNMCCFNMSCLNFNPSMLDARAQCPQQTVRSAAVVISCSAAGCC
jgi:hypothetical protein